MIAGQSNSGVDITHLPVLWEAGKGRALGILAGHLYGEAYDVSDPIGALTQGRHRIVAGFSNVQVQHPRLSPGAKPVYWSSTDPAAHALALPAGMEQASGEADCVSDDGTILGGALYDAATSGWYDFFIKSHACAWILDPQTGSYAPQLLEDLPGGDDEARVEGISGDGKVIVGEGTSAEGMQPCYWRLARVPTGRTTVGQVYGPAQPLPLPPGATMGFARGADFTGAIIGGGINGADEPDAVRWTSAAGSGGSAPTYAAPVRVMDLLAAHSITVPSGWHLWWIGRLSADGRTIIGDGSVVDETDPDVVTYQGWVAHVP